MDASCVFCSKFLDDEPTVVLRQKGCEGIERASAARGDYIRVVIGQKVHTKYRKDYTNPLMIKTNRKRSANESEVTEPHSLRSSGHFDYKKDCLFCGCSGPCNDRKSEFRVIPARILELRETILQACEKYSYEWVDTVKPRILFAPDLPAAD